MYILRKTPWDKCSWDEGEEETFKWEKWGKFHGGDGE